MEKKILVLDASVFISAIGWNGKTVNNALKMALNNYKVLVPSQFLDEVNEFIQKVYIGKKKTKFFPKAFLFILERLVSDGKIEPTKIHKILDFCRDKADNVYISLAVESKAEFLLTGDNDLLDIREKIFKLAKVRIVNPSEFLKLSSGT